MTSMDSKTRFKLVQLVYHHICFSVHGNYKYLCLILVPSRPKRVKCICLHCSTVTLITSPSATLLNAKQYNGYHKLVHVKLATDELLTSKQ